MARLVLKIEHSKSSSHAGIKPHLHMELSIDGFVVRNHNARLESERQVRMHIARMESEAGEFASIVNETLVIEEYDYVPKYERVRIR